jgi:hypothetical protein
MTTAGIPDGLPVLSRGKHRTPRKGACFMEMASVLAGEPWSDRPRCTHPLLSQLARLVNDHTSDAGRARLVPLIPEVIGVRGAGFEWEVGLVAAVASQAVYDAPQEAQHALAAGLLRCQELSTDAADQRAIADALELVPEAAAWARGFIGDAPPLKPRNFQRHSAPAVLHTAVRGTAQAAISDPDAHLHALLRTGLDAAHRPAGSASPLDAVHDVLRDRHAGGRRG